MLTNCRIVSIDQLLLVGCGKCKGNVIKLGSDRDDLQQRNFTPQGLPDFLQRQYHLAEKNRHAYRLDTAFFCSNCMEFSDCARRYNVKLAIYSPHERSLRDLVMYDQAAVEFFGCTAEEYLELYRKDETLGQRLGDFMTETTWNITLETKKKSESNWIASLTPILKEACPAPIIPFLTNSYDPPSDNDTAPSADDIPPPSSSSFVLDPGLSLYF